MLHRHFTIGATSALAAVVLLALGAPGASASPIQEHTHHTISYTGPDEICGIPGSDDVSGVDNFQVLGNGTFKDQERLRNVFTSAATGKSIVMSLAYQGATSTAVTNPDGSTTVVDTEKGLLEQIKLPHGPVISRDAGALTFSTTFNADGSERSSTLVGENGPHPDFDSGYNLGCDLIVPALS